MVKKDVATLSQWLQCIMLCILCKLGPSLFIGDWLSQHNHAENKDHKILGMKISIHIVNTTADIPVCMSIDGIKVAIEEDAMLQRLKKYIIKGWLHIKNRVEPGLEKYLLIKHELAMIDGIAMKGYE